MKKIKRILLILFFAVLAVSAIFPAVYIVSNSFMSSKELDSRYTEKYSFDNKEDEHFGKLHYVRMSLVPDESSTESYETIWGKNPSFWRSFWNSFLIIIPIVFFQWLLAPLTAYGFEMSDFRFKETIFYIYVIVMMLPTVVTLVPDYLLISRLGLKDSYLGVIMPSVLNPIGVFIVRQQLKGFNRSILEAAELDGCGTLRCYRSIVLPNITSSVAVSLLIIFTDNWNMIEQIQIFISSSFDKTLPVFLSIQSSAVTPFFLAASSLFLIPAVFFFVFVLEKVTAGGAYGTEADK